MVEAKLSITASPNNPHFEEFGHILKRHMAGAGDSTVVLAQMNVDEMPPQRTKSGNNILFLDICVERIEQDSDGRVGDAVA